MRAWQGMNVTTVQDPDTREALRRVNIQLKELTNAVKILSGGGSVSTGGGSTQSYITVVNEASLSGERALAVQAPVTKSDGGANSSLTLGVATAVPSGGYGTTALAGSAGSVIRSDARLKYPEALMSLANSSTLTLTDTGVDQVLTGSLGNIFLDLATSGQFIVDPSAVTAPGTTMVVRARTTAGTRTVMAPSWFSPGASDVFSGQPFRTWDVQMVSFAGQHTNSKIVGYDLSTVTIAPSASSGSGNSLYGYNTGTFTINNTNATWSEVTTAYFKGVRRNLSNVTITTQAAMIIEPPTASTADQVGLIFRQQTAQATAAGLRAHITMDAHNSGTNKRSISAAAADQADFSAVTGVYAPGSLSVANGAYAILSRRLQLTGSQRATLAGTATLRLT